MKVENKLARFMRNTGPARFFIPVGVILIIFGVLLSGFNAGNMIGTTGTVTAVEEVTNDDNETEYDVSFTFVADGKEYSNTFYGLLKSSEVGDEISVYYDADDPNVVSNAKLNGIEAPLLIGVGAVAILAGIFMSVRAFKKSKDLDELRPADDTAVKEAFANFKDLPGVTEYYFLYDGNTFKPGYLIEDANRNVLFEGKNLKNSLVGARIFEFNDHTSGSVKEHEVGHTTTTSYNNEFFSESSWFKFDGENIWDVLHNRDIRLSTDLHSKFPSMIYEATKNGEPFARIETSSIYVHEDEEAEHKLVIPYGKMYYRVWTVSKDFELLFLTIFAITETEQTVVE